MAVKTVGHEEVHASMKRITISYIETFAVAFGFTALANVEHILDARGLDALKAAAFAAILAAIRAGVLAVRIRLSKPA